MSVETGTWRAAAAMRSSWSNSGFIRTETARDCPAGVGSRTASGTHGGEIARVKLAGVGEVEVVAGIGLTAELLEVVGGDRPAFGVGEGLVVRVVVGRHGEVGHQFVSRSVS